MQPGKSLLAEPSLYVQPGAEFRTALLLWAMDGIGSRSISFPQVLLPFALNFNKARALSTPSSLDLVTLTNGLQLATNIARQTDALKIQH